MGRVGLLGSTTTFVEVTCPGLLGTANTTAEVFILSDRLALAGAVEALEAEAWAQLNGFTSRAFKERVGLAVHRVDSAVCIVATHSPILAMNRVLALGCPDPASEAQIDEILALFDRSAKCLIHLSPLAEPAEIREWLVARGGYLTAPTIKLVRPLSAHERIDSTCELELRAVRADEIHEFEAIVSAELGVPADLVDGISSTIGRPGWRYYFALDSGEPVATAALFIRGMHAWFGLAATRDSHQRRGAQTALVAKRIEDAARAGCTYGSADTSVPTAERPNQSLKNMQRLGFESLYERINYIIPLRTDPT